MLITRSGFYAFNEYDLTATLDAQLKKLRDEVKLYTKANELNKIPSLSEKYKIQLLEFNIQNLTVEIKNAKIPAEVFPSGFFVIRGNSYDKDVLVFHLPFSGDQNLLRCVPSTRVLWTEEIAIENNEIIFELIKFIDNSEEIARQKDKFIDLLNKQSTNVNKQVEQYNNSIDGIIKETKMLTHEELSKQDEFLTKLGIPIKKNTITSSSVVIKTSSSQIIDKKPQVYDIFICHASEDKEYVDRLANFLKDNGINVWYDAFQIGWGDDLRPEIDNGLKNSKYGIVIFSRAFLNKKKWTEYELNGLFSKEKSGQKVILPIWHNITRDDISQYSPTFADRIAKRSDDINSILNELKELLQK